MLSSHKPFLMSFYYLNRDNQPVGPMELVAIGKLADAGIVQPDVSVCEAGQSEWKPLSQFRESAEEPSTVKPPRTPPPQRQPKPTGKKPQAMRHAPTGASSDWQPLASLVTGILAIVSLFFSPLLSFLFGGAALTLGILVYQSSQLQDRPFSVAGIATGAVSIVVALGVALSGVGSSSSAEARSIEKVLTQVMRVEKEANKSPSSDSATTARFFARELLRIDTRSCPPEFRVAYQDLVAAWETAIPYLSADTALTTFLEGFVGGLTSDYSGVGRSGEQAQLAIQQIRSSAQALHRIAVAHGARIPTQ